MKELLAHYLIYTKPFLLHHCSHIYYNDLYPQYSYLLIAKKVSFVYATKIKDCSLPLLIL